MHEQSAKMRLLDDLLGGPVTFANAVAWLSDGDRARMLKSIVKMCQDGYLLIMCNGADVSDWQLAEWARTPNETATVAAMKAVSMDITDKGVHIWYPPTAQ